MLSRPVAIWNRIPPTSSSRVSRSSTWASERAGGQSNSFGSTDQSLPSTTGMSTIPSVTCRPWVTRNSQDGRVGQSKSGSRSQPTLLGNAWSKRGP